MDMSSIMVSLSGTTNTPAALSSPPLRSTIKLPLVHSHARALPSLAVAIGAAGSSPQNAQTNRRASASRVARSILQSAVSKNRKSRVVFDFTEEEMAQYYHLPQRVAAKRLGVAVITIKRNCKRRGIKWPYRAEKLKEIQSAKSAHRRRQGKKSATISNSSSNNDCSESGGKSARDPSDAMLLLSEAARAFSRLPLECMFETRQV